MTSHNIGHEQPHKTFRILPNPKSRKRVNSIASHDASKKRILGVKKPVTITPLRTPDLTSSVVLGGNRVQGHLSILSSATRASLRSINRDLSYALDPVALMRAADLIPDAWQERLLLSNATQHLVVCHRQAGKSTVAAALALAEALFHPNAPVLLLSPTLRQSQELYRKVTDILARLPDPPSILRQTSTFLEFANGSRIVSLPGEESTVRGYSNVSLLVVDEAARVPDELYYAVRPMLAVSGGKLICLSTPWGRRGFFYQEWSGGDGWARYSVTADECPRIPRQFLVQEQRTLGPHKFAEEYMCEFIAASHCVFDEDRILNAFDPDVRPLFPREA